MLRNVNRVSITTATMCVSAIAAFAALLFLAIPAQADENDPAAESESAPAQDDYSRMGCYLGLGGLNASSLTPKDFLNNPAFGPSLKIDDGMGINARAGCRGKWGCGEAHFEWIESFDYRLLGREFEVETWAFTADGKVYPFAGFEDYLPPLAKRFQPFATVGFGYLSFDNSKFETFLGKTAKAAMPPVLPPDLEDWDFALRLGGGMDVYLTRHIAVSADVTWVRPLSKDMDELDYISIGWGFLYRF